METLQYDPKTKHQIKEALYAFLYSPIKKRLFNTLSALIIKNTLLTKSGHRSFVFKGVLYTQETTPAPRPWTQLHPSLAQEMKDYLAEVAEIDSQEMPYVMGYLNQVLNSSDHLCDYLHLLPHSLHYPIRDLIDRCPCRTSKLTEPEVETIQKANQTAIAMINQRMALNLLI